MIGRGYNVKTNKKILTVIAVAIVVFSIAVCVCFAVNTGNRKTKVDTTIIHTSEMDVSELNDFYIERYEELRDLYANNPRQFSKKESDLLQNITGFYAQETKNIQVVQLTKVTKNRISTFKKLFGDDERVTFEKSQFAIDV